MILNQNNNLFINNLLFYLSISSIFFITNNFISYKILFGFQTIVFFYLVYSADALYFNKKLLFFNFLIIFLFFFNFTRESIYLLLICFCNVFVDYKKLKNINLKYNNFFLIIFLILFIALLRKFPEHISIYEYFTMFSDPDHPYKSIFNKIEEFSKNARWGFLKLNSNLATVLSLLIVSLLLKANSIKNFKIWFTIIGFIIIFLMKSKSGFLFYFFILITSFIKIRFRSLIVIFLVANIFLIVSSSYLIKNFPNPYRNEGKLSQALVLDFEACKKIQNKLILIFSECPGYKYSDGNPLDHKMLKIFGYSLYYKFYTYGLTIDHIRKNSLDYLSNNPLYYLKENKKISDYEIGNHLAAHSFFLGTFIHLGLIFGLLFFLNLAFFLYQNNNILIFPIFLISSTFLSFDIMLFFPILLLNFFLCYKENDKNIN